MPAQPFFFNYTNKQNMNFRGVMKFLCIAILRNFSINIILHLNAKRNFSNFQSQLHEKKLQLIPEKKNFFLKIQVYIPESEKK
jgi:hypothetical protein